VADLFRAEVRSHLVPVAVTGGHQALRDDTGGQLVPKEELVSALKVLLQARRLQVATPLPEADVLAQELSAIQIEVSLTSDEPVSGWRLPPHDDLVLVVVSGMAMNQPISSRENTKQCRRTLRGAS
jgi:hypothetical protein